MKALTIWQPWASLIIAGAKPVEWRGWACPRWIVGQRIAIHAGTRAAKPAEIADIIERIDDDETSLISEIARPLLTAVHTRSWPLSSVLGTAIIGRPIPVIEWLREHAPDFLDSDRIDHSKFAWPLTGIERFEPVIPARGAQGFWDWSYTVDRAADG
jgi:hypothetical protein